MKKTFRTAFALSIVVATVGACGKISSTVSKLPNITEKRLLFSYAPLRKSVWSAPGMAETPVLTKDTIYYLSGYPWNNQVYLHALDKETGALKWTCKDEIGQFLLDGDKFYGSGRINLFRTEPARTSKCFVRAYSTKTGLALWDHPALTDRRGIKLLGFDKDKLFIHSNMLLSALDKSTGQLAWRNTTTILPSVVPNVVMSGGFIFAELSDRNIGKFTPQGFLQGVLKTSPIDAKLPRVLISNDDMLLIGGGDGNSKVVKIKVDRQQNIDTGWLTSKLIIENGMAYFGAQTTPLVEQTTKLTVKPAPQPERGGVYMCAFDLERAKYAWKTEVETHVRSGPLLANGVIYAGAVRKDKSYLYAFNAADGKVLWQSECETPLSNVAYGDGMIFVNGGGTLNAIEASTGKNLWMYRLKDAQVMGDPVFENGIVYIVGDDSNLYALKSKLSN